MCSGLELHDGFVLPFSWPRYPSELPQSIAPNPDAWASMGKRWSQAKCTLYRDFLLLGRCVSPTDCEYSLVS